MRFAMTSGPSVAPESVLVIVPAKLETAARLPLKPCADFYGNYFDILIMSDEHLPSPYPTRSTKTLV